MLSTAASFALFGVSAAAMKGAMLVLWLVGAGFFVAAARRAEGERAALLAAILIVACAAWGAWSLKARGGYLTSFVCANVALWLVLDRVESSSRRDAARIRDRSPLRTCLVSKALWLVPRTVRRGALDADGGPPLPLQVALPALLVALSIHSIGLGQATGDYRPSLVNVSLWQGLVSLPLLVWHTLGGAFEMRQAVDAPAFALAASVWSMGVLMVIAIALFQLRSSRRLSRRHLSWIGIGALLCAELPSNVPRYLLPAIDHAILWMAAELAVLVSAGRARFGSAVLFSGTLALAGTVGILALSRVSYVPQVALDARGEHEALEDFAVLEARGVHHLCMAVLALDLMFRTHEQVRPLDRCRDRDPVSAAVDRAGWASPTALVAHRDRARIAGLMGADARIDDIGARYLLVERPSDTLLAALGFARVEDP